MGISVALSAGYGWQKSMKKRNTWLHVVHVQTMGISPSVIQLVCERTWCKTTLLCIFRLQCRKIPRASLMPCWASAQSAESGTSGHGHIQWEWFTGCVGTLLPLRAWVWMENSQHDACCIFEAWSGWNRPGGVSAWWVCAWQECNLEGMLELLFSSSP